MNSAGVIRADGHASVHIGDSYSTIHDCADSRRHLAEADKAKIRIEFLQRLYTSPYEDRKNRNPKRANGTCEWFTAHHLFQNWLRETSALLWVSADPGLDELLPPSASRTTALEGALCCILHQLFTQNPGLLSDKILDYFEEEGNHLFTSFSKLWDTLIEATKPHKNGEIICTRLAKALTEHYSEGKGTSTLKFLDLKQSQPTIHLSGEGQGEVDKIAHEINIVIQQRIEELSKGPQIGKEEKEILKDELASIRHRTYLWVHLVFAAIEDAIFLTKGDLLEEAYDSILRKSHDPDKAKKILQIIVAADRPLLLTEMAAVLAFRGETHRCHEDLDRDILSLDRLYTAIRETCGLFVVVQDSQVYLLHQTAREFLVQVSPDLLGVRCSSLEWQHTINLKEYLLLADFKKPAKERRLQGSGDRSGFVFLDYAASNWTDHYRQAYNTLGTDLEILAMQLCDTSCPSCSYWLQVYGERRMQDQAFPCELPTSLLIVSFFGLDNLVNLVLKEKKTSLETTGAQNGRTALSWASEKGYHSIVQLLLDRVPKPIVILRDSLLSSFSTIVNRTDRLGRSPLWHAAANGHQIIPSYLKKSRDKTPTLTIYRREIDLARLLL
ncbi:hypothetical protein F4860DRAFT_503931 [Xylaria cubensis]|nr:hypothetical protein F4860DRAFT_503931 [Xylaria cubensis]